MFNLSIRPELHRPGTPPPPRPPRLSEEERRLRRRASEHRYRAKRRLSPTKAQESDAADQIAEALDFRPRARTFTADDDAKLLAMRAQGQSFYRIAKTFGRRLGGIKARYTLLTRELWAPGKPIPNSESKRRPWRPEEETYLRGNWGIHPKRAIAQHLKRTVAACHGHALRLGLLLKRPTLYYTDTLTRIFGVHRSAVSFWRQQGYLVSIPLHKPNKRAGTPIEVASIKRFIQERPWEYDYHLMQPDHPFTLLAAEVQGDDPWLTTDELARRLHYRRTTITHWADWGWLPTQLRRRSTKGRPHYVARLSDARRVMQEHRPPSRREQLARDAEHLPPRPAYQPGDLVEWVSADNEHDSYFVGRVGLVECLICTWLPKESPTGTPKSRVWRAVVWFPTRHRGCPKNLIRCGRPLVTQTRLLSPTERDAFLLRLSADVRSAILDKASTKEA